MCGIVGGVFRYALPSSGAREAFANAAQTLSHRGPDDAGIEVIAQANAILGFRRLSIIDLAAGHQPMSTESGQHIVFNGEAYNYRERRRELEAQGLRFRTASDTEVLLHDFAHSGIASLTRLKGMWAFALLDVPRRRLWLVRDRLGVKQLYFSFTDQAILFASEPKALLSLPWVRRGFNEDEMGNYLTFRCVPSPNTLYRDVNKLPPGTAMEIDLATWRSHTHRYWSPPEAHPDPTLRFEGGVSRLEDALLTSVKRRLVSDVPVGALLSGGLDSSLVVAAMSRLGHPDIRTFSAVFPGSRDDEAPFSQRVAARFGARHHERPATAADFLSCLPEWVDLNDDLVADASSLPLLLVSRLARASGCKVLLSGEGADELFGGYGSYHKYLLLRKAARVLPSKGLRKAVVTWLTAAGLVRAQDVPRVLEYFVRAGAYLGTAALCGPEDLAAITDGVEGYSPARASESTLDALGSFDFARRIPDDLLVRTDRATMGSSIEARVPFLDHDLVEVVSRLPRWTRALPGVSKIGLRVVAARWGVPLSTVAHRKIGFQVPLGRWFRNELKGLWERVLAERVVPGLHYDELARLFNAHTTGAGDFEELLWRVAALELWYRRWILGTSRNEILAVSSTSHVANDEGQAVAPRVPGTQLRRVS